MLSCGNWPVTTAVYYSSFTIRLQIFLPQTFKSQLWKCLTQNSTLQMTRKDDFIWCPPISRCCTQHTLLVCGAVGESTASPSRCLRSIPACWHAQSEQSSRFGWFLWRSNGAEVWICHTWDLLPALGGETLCNMWPRGRVRTITVCQQGYEKCQKYGLWCAQDYCQPFEVVKPKPYIFSSVPSP